MEKAKSNTKGLLLFR